MKTLCNIPATLFAAAVLMAGLCPATDNVHVSSLYLVPQVLAFLRKALVLIKNIRDL